ncbi:hypothetical protein CDO25_11120 [Sinorhizobium meliloti]|nr:hypothetical protein CDO25_11120 [Sinorhizobium meliloti]
MVTHRLFSSCLGNCATQHRSRLALPPRYTLLEFAPEIFTALLSAVAKVTVRTISATQPDYGYRRFHTLMRVLEG